MGEKHRRSRAGRQILEDCDKGDPLFESTIKNHINDCLGTKADSTVLGRANALMKYLNWHSIRFLESPYPISEKAVYEYLHSNINPTGGVAFLESLNFAGGIFGIDGALEAAASRRAKGTVERMYATKQITCRADPFRVEHIESLTAMLFEDSVHLHDRCVAGFLLMLVSLRARSSDAHRIAKNSP